MADISAVISDLIVRVATIAWGLFMLTWSIGWLLRGSPIPFLRVKRAGQDMVEDAIWAAFWLAIGTSIFALVAYIASLFGPTMPINGTSGSISG